MVGSRGCLGGLSGGRALAVSSSEVEAEADRASWKVGSRHQKPWAGPLRDRRGPWRPRKSKPPGWTIGARTAPDPMRPGRRTSQASTLAGERSTGRSGGAPLSLGREARPRSAAARVKGQTQSARGARPPLPRLHPDTTAPGPPNAELSRPGRGRATEKRGVRGRLQRLVRRPDAGRALRRPRFDLHARRCLCKAVQGRDDL